jgi:tRNA pseudouridine38-40 synthase
VLPQGSGRTDTGVHALGQVATFTLTVPIPATNLHRALNRALPSSIRVLSVEPVPEDFHARHSARRKTYEYRILPNDQICSPMLAPFVWASHLSLKLDPLQQAAALIIGTHDFTSFAASDPDLTTRLKMQSDSTSAAAPPSPPSAAVSSPPQLDFSPSNKSQLNQSRPNQSQPNQSQPNKDVVISAEGGALPAAVERPPQFLPSADTAIIPTDNTRTIFHSDWHQQEDLLIYRVTGSGFLHHMVRNLVGTFVDPTFIPDEIPTILSARNRSAAGPTAPARGLFLVGVEY